MTVTAPAANNLPVAARVDVGMVDVGMVDVGMVDVGMVDMRQGTPVRAGTYPYDGDDLVTGWHTHDLHQIEYAFQGVVEVETSAGHFLLPPQQAVWIPAGLAHCTTLRQVRSVSVFFDPRMVRGAGDRARILAAAPVIREMIVYGARWPITRAASDPIADAFFEALAVLVLDWLDHETPLCLPTSTDPIVNAVMAYTSAHLDGVTAADVCRAVGLSDRTLRRVFPAATGMTWRSYLLESRLLRSMALLAEPGRTVLDVATTVGFGSLSAFTRAFNSYTGDTPTGYRRRVTARGVPDPRPAPDSSRSAAPASGP
jgi:AraC-like DNA-binding protein